MKFDLSARFESDFAALPAAHRRMFRECMRAFSAGCDAWVANGLLPHPWPANQRIHRLSNSMIWSMTWHYGRPDGRVTFEFATVDDEVLVRWRRIGGHEIYADE